MSSVFSMNRFYEAVRSVVNPFQLIFKQKHPNPLALEEGEPNMLSGDLQQSLENRVACGICLEPRLRMVTGKCQHRFCVQCMYDTNGIRRGLNRCPSCQVEAAFPTTRPVVPEDMIEIQRALGVRDCPKCGEEMWERELDEHIRTCGKSPSPPCPKKSTSSRRRQKSDHPDEHKAKRYRKTKNNNEILKLMGDFGPGVRTRSQSSGCSPCMPQYGASGSNRCRARPKARKNPYK